MKPSFASWLITLSVIWLAIASLIALPQIHAQASQGSPSVTTVGIGGKLAGPPQGPPLEASSEVTPSHRVFLPFLFDGTSAPLTSPDIEVSPLSLQETLTWGAALTRTVTITNRGSAPLEFKLTEVEGRTTPMRVAAGSLLPTPQSSAIAVAIYDHGDINDISYWHGYNSNAWDVYQNILETDLQGRFRVTIITDLSPSTLAGFSRLVLPDNAVPDTYLDAVASWFTPGKRIVAVDSATCYAAYSGFMWPGSARSNGYGMYWDYGSNWGDQEILIRDKITQDYTVGQVVSSQSDDAEMFSAALPPDALQLTASHADHSMIYVSYREVPYHGTLVVLGPYAPVSGSDVYELIRDAVEGGGRDTAWLSEQPITGTVSSHSAVSVAVVLDASAVAQPGVFRASLYVTSNDPDMPVVSVPVTMTVPPDPAMGKLSGAIASDRPGGVLAGALVEVMSGATVVISGTTDASGGYGDWWLMNGPYQVVVSAEGYLIDTQNIAVSAGVTTTHSVVLTLNAPRIEISPGDYEEGLAWDELVTRTLTITNSGPQSLEFELAEIGGESTPMQTMQTMQSPAPGGKSLTAEEKVEAQVWAELGAAANGQTEFIVLFREQADLRPAYTIRDWKERGDFVLKALRQTAESSQAQALAQLQNASQQGQPLRVSSHYIINAMVVKGSAEAVKMMAARPEVAAIRAVRTYPVPQPIQGRAEPTAEDGVEWNIARIRADRVWQAFGVRGEGIVVANIDTGVRYTHDALVAQYRGNQGGGSFDHNYNWWDPNMVYLQPTDNNGHGTHTMGTMVGNGGPDHQIGVAPGAKWIAAQGCDSSSCSEADLISAAEWILAPWNLTGDRSTADPSKRPHVVNNSWGGYGGDAWYMNYVDAWRAAGIFPAFSIGNNGSGCSTADSPGDYPQSFGTGATDSADTIAYFSSRGSSYFGGVKPNVSAPGVNVLSAWSGGDSAYYSISGTSMASPHSAGLVALMWSANRGLIGRMDETTHMIQEAALPIADAQCGEAGPPNNVYGWGRIDAYETLAQVDSDVPWLAMEPVSGTVPAYSALPVTVTFDASQGGQPGVHRAALLINSNDPYSAHLRAPITMTLQPHPDMGKIVGAVTSDRPGGALGGALVEITSGAAGVISYTTDAAGGYGPWWLMSGVYSVTVSAGDYLDDSQAVTISAGVTTTHNVTLALDAPQLQLAPEAFHVTLGEGGTLRRTMTVSNSGVGALTFVITETTRSLTGSSALIETQASGQATVVAENKTTPEAAPQEAAGLASGGPDPFGYTYRDSNDPAGPRYTWIEIAPPAGGSGSELPLDGVDDGYYWPLALPFNFNFYGTDYPNLAVNTNGTLYFTDQYMTYVNAPIPGFGSGVDRFIANLWDDLYVSPGGIYYQRQDDRLIVEYYQVMGLGSSDWGTWEAILFDSGSILFQYQDVTFGDSRNGGGSATVGIQGGTTQGLQYSYNRAALSQGLAICFAYPGQSADCSLYEDVPWLSAKPISGTLLAGGALPLEVTFDAAGLSTGVYTGALVVLSNDPDRRQVVVPVTLDVGTCQTALAIDPLEQERVLAAGPFSFTTVISDVTDLGSFEFDLAYDPAVVHLDGVTLAPFPGSSGRTVYPVGPVIDNGAGAASFGAYSAGAAPGPNGMGTLAVLTMSPQSLGAGALTLRDAQVTDTRGQPALACARSGRLTVAECLSADFDCDCDVDSVDMAVVTDRWGCELGEACYDRHYDVDGDGDIDIVDIMRVSAYLGWTCAAPAPFQIQAGAATGSVPAWLSLAGPAVEAGEPLVVEVVLDDAQALGGFEVELTYDPRVVRLEGAAMGDLLGSTGRTVYPLWTEIDAQAGRVKVGGVSSGKAPGASGSGVLARFTLVSQGQGDPGLKLQGARLVDVGGRLQAVELAGK
jgi:subtilisin family serine protease